MSVSSVPPVSRIPLKHSNHFFIFLDIDGVLSATGEEYKRTISKAFRKVFPALQKSEEDCEELKQQREKEWFKFMSKDFNSTALSNLHVLINEMQKVRSVWIVISSNWRKGRSVDDLKTILLDHPFSCCIFDKTPDSLPWEAQKAHCQDPVHSLKNQGCRRAEIAWWLKEHPEVIDYAVIDDNDSHLSIGFGEKFYHVCEKELLTRQTVERIIDANTSSEPQYLSQREPQ